MGGKHGFVNVVQALAPIVLLLLLFVPAASAATYEGRVEAVEQSTEPHFPAEYLQPNAPASDPIPDQLAGQWYGNVEIAQLEMYPQLYAGHPYWTQFVQELSGFFHLHQPGKVTLLFKRHKNGTVTLLSSDVWLKRGGRLQMTSGKGPAVVRGGFNMPVTVADKVRAKAGVVDQTRIDKVSIVNNKGNQIQHGYSEISAHYELQSPRRMTLKLLEIDYDDQHKPLWKVLLRGTATR